jgi:hypothetical protein
VTEAPKVSKVVFRVQQTANLAALLLAITATPFAFALPGLQLVYLVPIAMVVWVQRNQTIADTTGLTARTTFTKSVLRWDELASLKVGKRRGLLAVRADESTVKLPCVRVRHLAVLSAVSGGVVPDPGSDDKADDKAENDTVDDTVDEKNGSDQGVTS